MTVSGLSFGEVSFLSCILSVYKVQIALTEGDKGRDGDNLSCSHFAKQVSARGYGSARGHRVVQKKNGFPTQALTAFEQVACLGVFHALLGASHLLLRRSLFSSSEKGGKGYPRLLGECLRQFFGLVKAVFPSFAHGARHKGDNGGRGRTYACF